MTDTPHALAVDRATLELGGRTILRDVSFSIEPGEFVGVLGPNGAGKTTILSCIEGLRRPDEGTVSVLGHDVAQDVDAIKARLGVSLQSTALFPLLTTLELLEVYAAMYDRFPGRAALERLLARFDLADKAKAQAKELSGGQQQRLALAIALVNDPAILFLDEPTTGLDPQARRNFWELIQSIKARRKSIILTTHYMDEAELLCDDIAIMDRGRIIARGGPRQLLQQHFEEVLIELPRLDFPEAARRLPWKIVDSSDRIEIATQDVETTLRTLLDLHVPLKHLRIRPPNMEDLFLELTGKELRP